MKGLEFGFVAVALLLMLWALPAQAGNRNGAASGPITQGSLISLDDQGRLREQCPLKHTDVKAEVSGFLARIRVTQQFENPFADKIEAVYTFPLPQRAAVDDLTLTVGDRVVKGRIKPREEAQAIYEAARRRGHVAGLLDQERPNIFTQAIANIRPGEKVTVTISYVETLKYEDGVYHFAFPMVVGPRYIPGTVSASEASRLTPPVTPADTRAGHDIALEVVLDAGVPIGTVGSPSHAVAVERPAADRAFVRLQDQAAIPNKDFFLSYGVSGRSIGDTVLSHRNGRDGFFTLVLQPPDRVPVAEVTPKELVFVLDTSGSMSGFPIEKAKETMMLALDGLYPSDTFNLITFSGDTHILFPKPVPATPENLRQARAFLESRSGGGGTEMMKAIRAALASSAEGDRNHIRIVCFMTDGYVGNDLEILAEIQRHPQARVFSFGIGSSVNRFLLDKMAEYGRGEVEYVGLHDDGSAAARRFHERVRNPLLTDIAVDWAGLPVTEVYPKRIPDLFAAKPVVVTGRYTAAGRGVIRLSGLRAGRRVVREVPVELPDSEPRHDVLASLWARARIDDLMGQDMTSRTPLGQDLAATEAAGAARGAEVRKAITQLGLDYRLMTQYTSFVAVEELTVTEGGEPRRIDVPVEMPEGVSYEGVFGVEAPTQMAMAPTAPGMGFERSLRAEARRMAPRSRDLAGVAGSALAKLHPTVAAVIERLKAKRTAAAAEEAQFVRNGKAWLQVWLSDTSAETIARLRKLGVEIVAQPRTAQLVIARVPLEKLAALAELAVVRYVAPQTAGL
jgi:Ca-activated chloride channel family protein